MPNLSLKTKRLVTGSALALLIAAIANLYVTRIFGKHDRQIVVATAILLAIAIMYIGPSLQEIRDYRDQRRGR